MLLSVTSDKKLRLAGFRVQKGIEMNMKKALSPRVFL
jgi:hypothetical protein